ncbi:MAG: hypothetical protein ACMXX9_04170 [Candidatus Woesearchaeota archaeon]
MEKNNSKKINSDNKILNKIVVGGGPCWPPHILNPLEDVLRQPEESPFRPLVVGFDFPEENGLPGGSGSGGNGPPGGDDFLGLEYYVNRPSVDPRLINLAKKVYNSNNKERAKHLVRVIANHYESMPGNAMANLSSFADDSFNGFGEDSDIVRGLAKGAISYLADKLPYKISNPSNKGYGDYLTSQNKDFESNEKIELYTNHEVDLNINSKSLGLEKNSVYKNIVGNEYITKKEEISLSNMVNSDYVLNYNKESREDFFANSKRKQSIKNMSYTNR